MIARPVRWLVTLLAVVLSSPQAYAYEIHGLPGSSWGLLSYDNDQISGSGVQGFVNQGVDWFVLPGDITVNTFVEYRHRSRTHNQRYYDAGGPAVGLDLHISVVHVGVDYYWENLPVLGEKSERAQAYATTFIEWDLAQENHPTWFAALPGSFWGAISYDNDKISGSGVMGFINQGIDWIILPGDIAVNTYAEYRHRSRNENQKYYDAGGPAVGLELRKSPVRLGVDYYWERLPVLGESSERAQIYFGWYFDWNLK
ncbi:MAG: hypothetical protein HY751_04125 [Nitrospinae bacterium]|nr:hypothetical protein [Nitrospinota bacterium]